MKLRNKKTGEIIETLAKISFVEKHSGIKCFDSIDLLNEEWEDYEEPKDFWYIDVECGVMCDSTDTDLQDKRYPIEFMKSIGNYFETKEEAEKAEEKLRAWKRLKDARFKFKDFCYDLDEESSNLISADGQISFEMMCYEDFIDDLNLLFGK